MPRVSPKDSRKVPDAPDSPKHAFEVSRTEVDRLQEAYRNNPKPADAKEALALSVIYGRLDEQKKLWPRAKSLKLVTTRNGFAHVANYCARIVDGRWNARRKLTRDEHEWLAPLNELQRRLSVHVAHEIDRKLAPLAEPAHNETPADSMVETAANP